MRITATLNGYYYLKFGRCTVSPPRNPTHTDAGLYTHTPAGIRRESRYMLQSLTRGVHKIGCFHGLFGDFIKNTFSENINLKHKTMANHYDVFVSAINDKKMVKIKCDTKEKGVIERICIPFDNGPSRKYKDGLDRFHFYDLDSPDGKHNLSILEAQLINIELMDEIFEPGDYVKWEPNWILKRDWGKFS
jgi:hypothetical protein